MMEVEMGRKRVKRPGAPVSWPPAVEAPSHQLSPARPPESAVFVKDQVRK